MCHANSHLRLSLHYNCRFLSTILCNICFITRTFLDNHRSITISTLRNTGIVGTARLINICKVRVEFYSNEQIFIVNPDDETTTKQYIPRETLRRVSTPQAYQFKKLDAAYHEAFEKGIGIHGSSYTNTMMVELGETLHFAAGSDKNIKLTTKDDLEMFKGYMKMDKDTWLK